MKDDAMGILTNLLYGKTSVEDVPAEMSDEVLQLVNDNIEQSVAAAKSSEDILTGALSSDLSNQLKDLSAQLNERASRLFAKAPEKSTLGNSVANVPGGILL